MRDSLYAIYVCLRKLEGKMSNAELLSKRLDIPVETVRGIIKRLKKYGVIRDSRKIRNGFAQGAICELNSEMRVYLAGTDRRKTQIALGLAAQAIDPSQMYDPLQKDGDGAVASNPSTHLTSTLSTAPSARTPAELHSSSILNLEEKTTTWGRQEILAELEIPVHSYWVEKGITAKTIQDWAQKHKLEVPVIFRSMEHCRWDIERNGKKVTSNEMGLLYGSLKAHGIYYEPKGYKTHAQEQAERAREILERDMQILAELKESNLKREQLKVEIEFEKMMADEHCEMYQACLQMQPKAMRDSRTGPDLRRMQPDVFRDGMWNAFREIKNKTPLPE